MVILEVSSGEIHLKTPDTSDHSQVGWCDFLQRPSFLFHRISRNSGLLKPGEMCLVLGCPGAGCTTFLKTVANERTSFAGVYGDVRYAGISHDEMLKYYKGEVVYNEEGEDFL